MLPIDAVADVLHAGTDVDCGGFVSQSETTQTLIDSVCLLYGPLDRTDANASLINGTITVDDIDTVLKRLFRVRLRLGQFDPPGPLSTIGPDQVWLRPS